MMAKTALICCSGLLFSTLGPSRALAQNFDHLRIDILGDVVRAPGGNQPSVSMSTGPLVIGQEQPAVIQLGPDNCGLGVSAGMPFQQGTIVGWRITVTPLKVSADDAVTFRYAWTKVRGSGQEVSASGEGDQGEVTLKPGASLPLDSVPISSAAALARRCGLRAASIGLRVGYWPWEQDERRLVQTDLWLVDRAADGTERSQSLSVRGLVNRATPFYFDTIVDNGVSLDLFGEIVARPDGKGLALKLETRSRIIEGGSASLVMPMSAMPTSRGPMNLMGPRKVETTLQLSATDVAAVQLPRLSENAGGAFANRTFSIRVRSRQVR